MSKSHVTLHESICTPRETGPPSSAQRPATSGADGQRAAGGPSLGSDASAVEAHHRAHALSAGDATLAAGGAVSARRAIAGGRAAAGAVGRPAAGVGPRVRAARPADAAHHEAQRIAYFAAQAGGAGLGARAARGVRLPVLAVPGNVAAAVDAVERGATSAP